MHNKIFHFPFSCSTVQIIELPVYIVCLVIYILSLIFHFIQYCISLMKKKRLHLPEHFSQLHQSQARPIYTPSFCMNSVLQFIEYIHIKMVDIRRVEYYQIGGKFTSVFLKWLMSFSRSRRWPAASSFRFRHSVIRSRLVYFVLYTTVVAFLFLFKTDHTTLRNQNRGNRALEKSRMCNIFEIFTLQSRV